MTRSNEFSSTFSLHFSFYYCCRKRSSFYTRATGHSSPFASSPDRPYGFSHGNNSCANDATHSKRPPRGRSRRRKGKRRAQQARAGATSRVEHQRSSGFETSKLETNPFRVGKERKKRWALNSNAAKHQFDFDFSISDAFDRVHKKKTKNM